MAGIQVIAGDFPNGRAELAWGVLVFPKQVKQGFDKAVQLDTRKELMALQILEKEDEDRVAKVAGTGLAGGLLFGPVGLLAGGLLSAAGKKKQTISFSATFRDGRQFTGSTDGDTFKKLQSDALNNQDGRSVTAPNPSDPISQLERLAKLKQQGLLTDAEFSAQKAKILG